MTNLQPDYYVKHPDGSFSLADPQPCLLQDNYMRNLPDDGLQGEMARNFGICS